MSYYENLETPIQIFEFTDPICTWCWGSEPQMRALEWRYGDLIDTDFIVGGLVKDIREFIDPSLGIGQDPLRSNAAIARHWLEASKRHGMPVNVEGFHLFDEHNVSSYPLCIAYKSAQFQSRADAKRFLRRMREAVAFEGRQANRTDVLLELAEECRLDIGMLLGDMRGRSGMRAFLDDLDACHDYGATGFPTYLIRVNGTEGLMKSYQPYENFVRAIDELSNGALQESPVPASEENVLSYVQRFKSVADKEVAVAFGIALGEATRYLDALIASGDAQETKAGNGRLVRITAQGDVPYGYER